jgi:HEAT repeat protein
MSKHRQWWVLLACGLAISLLVYQFEQRNQAQSFTARLDDISNAQANRAKAQDAIRQLGTNALPLLLQQLRYEANTNDFKHRLHYRLDNYLQAKPPNAVVSKPLINLYRWSESDREEHRAASALQVFFSLGEQARPAIPELAKLLNDPQFPSGSQRAFSALSYIGKESIPVLAAYLADTNEPSRKFLTQWFYNAWIGQCQRRRYRSSADEWSTNAISVPLLFACLASPNPREASGAAFILGVLVSTYPAEGAVVAALSNSPPTVRLTADRVPGQPTSDDRRFVPRLLLLLEDTDERVRNAAWTTLYAIDPEALANAPDR